MSLPKFTLLPWEFPGAPGSPRADAVTTVHWRGKEVTMRIKIRENRLFFAPVGEKGGRLWAVFGPLENTAEQAETLKEQPEKIIQRFHTATRKEMWGRVVFFDFQKRLQMKRSWHSERGLPLNYVMTTVKCDGKIELRLIYDDQFISSWVEWDEAPQYGLNLAQFETWPHARLARFLSAHLDATLKLVGDRTISGAATERADIALRFVKGSSKELLKLIQATSWLYESFDPIRTLHRNGKLEYFVVAQSITQKARIERNESHKVFIPEAVKRLFSLFLQLHFPVGQQAKQAGWNTQIYPRYAQLVVEAPTSHERLKAFALLHELTSGTPIEAAVSAVLSEFPPQF